MNDLLFDVPWWIPTLLGLVGLVAWWTSRDRPKSTARTVGLGCIALAILWSAVSYLVDTDKEKAINGTRALVKDVVDGHWSDFKARLAPDVSFRTEKSDARALGPDDLTETAKAGAESIHLKSASASRLEAHQTGPLITVSADIYSTQDMPGAPSTMPSSFEFDWEQTSSGWKVREIRIISIANQSASDIAGYIPRGKSGR